MSGDKLWTRGIEKLVFLLLALVLSGVGVALGSWSFSKIHHMRQLERVPQTPISALISGEVNLSGRIDAHEELLESPDTRSLSVYYRYHVEREERDSDGDTRWVTVKDERRSVPFKLDDKSGEVLIRPSNVVDFEVESDSRRTSGSMRYTEYLLEPDSKVFVFGYAHRQQDAYVVGFNAEGSYLPIISENSAGGERREMALWSALALIGSLACLSFAVVFLLGAFRAHHSAVYLISVSAVMVGVLAVQGLSMMKADLEDARDRARRALDESRHVISEALEAHDIEWSGDWDELGSFGDARYEALPVKQRARLSRVRLGLAQSIERTNQNRERFPEALLAPIWGVDRAEPVPLPPTERERLAALERDNEPTRVDSLPALIALFIGALAAIFASWKGLRKVSTKRTIENVPTSPIEGVAYGLCEIKGVAELADDQPVLHAPVTNRACIYYRHIIKRKNSDGDWRTVNTEEKSVSFWCRDTSGRLLVERMGARFIATQRRTSRSGNTKHIEHRISPGEDLYVLGSAEIDAKTHDRLKISQGHHELPFIVSALPEKTVMYKEGRSAFYLLNAGLLGTIVAVLGLTGTLGTFGPMLYMSAAAAACAFLFVMLFFLYYNDLIFLRERVDRNWSNIDVALKKRFDLISRLVSSVQGYLTHERRLQEALTAARATRQNPAGSEPSDDQALNAEQHARDHIVATIEAYPELQGQQLVERLMQNLTDVESEIALMRDGYNDAVERFNTRQHKFPEVVIAKMFGFKKASHFRTFGAEREAPDIAS